MGDAYVTGVMETDCGVEACLDSEEEEPQSPLQLPAMSQ